ncbi:MAG TPA: lanthionine synthetase LanC family protein [Longimicrobiaceae bacterium]|nr:lanthionine synthetase LanC family protein [Longimicrobiaceae bacterium]
MSEQSTAPQPPDDGLFLRAAQEIGARMVASAEWGQEEGCTWTIMAPDREQPMLRLAVPATAGAALYEGTAGMGLFLAELYGQAGGADVARAAEGGIRYSLAKGDELPANAFGLHAGRVGVALAATRAAELLGVPELRDRAEALLEPLVGHEAEDAGIDVIGGAAGAIPALLRMAMAGTVDRELAMGLARRLGDNLIAQADKEPEGWSWGTMRSSSARNLCGYAHGAAGPAHAFLELFDATGEGRFLHAAEQAFLYERAFLSPELGNWPDFRHAELGEFLQAGRLDELRELMAEAGFPAYQLRYMSAWCHGAPGIGLTRLRAYQLTGDPVYLAEARAAIGATLPTLADMKYNYSLCHGKGGNSDTLLVAAELLGEPELRRPAEEAGRQGWEAFPAKGQPWPCGTLGGVSDPGLLLGEAGIGHFYLRLHSRDVPSILLVTPEGEPRRPKPDAEYEEARRETVERNFGQTLRLFAALGEDADVELPPRREDRGPERSVAVEAYEALVRRTEDGNERLQDAFRLDRSRFELARSITDWTAELLDALARAPDDEVPWSEVTLSLSPRARVVHTQGDWDAWLADEQRGPEPEGDDVFFLLVAQGSKVATRRLSPFAAIVLDAVQAPATLDEVVGRVADVVSGPQAPDRAWLEQKVLEQLRQAYRAGFVDYEPSMASAAT